MWASERKGTRDHQQPGVSRMLRRVDLGAETQMGRALQREDADHVERDSLGPRNGAGALGSRQLRQDLWLTSVKFPSPCGGSGLSQFGKLEDLAEGGKWFLNMV